MPENENDKPVIRKTWIMLKKAAPEYAEDGLIMHFCGEDGYVGNNWISRINEADKLTVANTKAKPSYNSEEKYYKSATTSGKYGYGFKSSFSITTSENTSFEIVTRDIKKVTSCNNATNNTFIFAGNCGTKYGNYDPPKGSIVLKKFPSSNNGANNNMISLGIAGGTQVYKTHINNFADNSLDTFTVVPGKGMYHNGVKVSDCDVVAGTTPYGVMQTYASYNTDWTSANNCKIHAVRIYNRQLTEEEVKQNYETDKIIYGE